MIGEEDNRQISETETMSKPSIPFIKYRPEISGYPRYTEGSRYWLQWAGAPDSVYNRSD